MNERTHRGVDGPGRGLPLPGRLPRRGRSGQANVGRRFAGTLPCLAVALSLLACAPEGRPPTFPGSASSLTELTDRALGGLDARDTAELNGLRLSQTEHNDVVWPELPAASPDVNFPVDYAWTNLQLRNRRALSRLLPRLVGSGAERTGVACRGELHRFETFQVHTDCWVRFRTQSGDEIEAQLFKDVLERGGGYKIFRYYEEPYRVVNGAGDDAPELSGLPSRESRSVPGGIPRLSPRSVGRAVTGVDRS